MHCPSNLYLPLMFSHFYIMLMSMFPTWVTEKIDLQSLQKVAYSLLCAFQRDSTKFRTKSKCVTKLAQHQPHAGIDCHIQHSIQTKLNAVHGQCFSISKTATAMANTLVDNVQENMLQAWCIALVFLLVRLGKELFTALTYRCLVHIFCCKGQGA